MIKVQCDNHYTIGEAVYLTHIQEVLREVGFEPTRVCNRYLMIPAESLKSASLDHSDILALVVTCPTHPHNIRTPYFYTLFKVYTIGFL